MKNSGSVSWCHKAGHTSLTMGGQQGGSHEEFDPLEKMDFIPGYVNDTKLINLNLCNTRILLRDNVSFSCISNASLCQYLLPSRYRAQAVIMVLLGLDCEVRGKRKHLRKRQEQFLNVLAMSVFQSIIIPIAFLVLEGSRGGDSEVVRRHCSGSGTFVFAHSS